MPDAADTQLWYDRLLIETSFMSKYKYYFVSPFDQRHFHTRREAERFYSSLGRCTAVIYAKCHDGYALELKHKY